MQDPEFIAQLEKQNLDLNPISGPEIERVVKDMYGLPAAALDGARDLLPGI
jgi:hypothetical protein